MDWVLKSPQLHSTFSDLGFAHTDGYHINENCNAALEDILNNILTEDTYLRTYRRSINLGQNIKKDIIPVLIHAKEDKTVELLIKILVNVTIPIECLFNVDETSKTDLGRHTVFEINNLLSTTKTALTDHRATKVILDFLKKNGDFEYNYNLTLEQCHNICNTLLFLRNILHIPDEVNNVNQNYNGPNHTVQNQILWNLFSQGVDKILIKLMSIPDAASWGVTMVQLIALLYKDQHVTTLHKLLNIWLETSLSESSEDNESNTSPPNRGRNDSSPMLTSDPTSDSSDTGGLKSNNGSNSDNSGWDASRNENSTQANSTQACDKILEMSKNVACGKDIKANGITSKENKTRKNIEVPPETTNQNESSKGEKKVNKSETSDCGYATQIENQESISTTSNDDNTSAKKPAHQKPPTQKPRVNNKICPPPTTQEKKRKKIVKRGKSNIINVQGLTHSTPTDDDISNVLKEFTVDFLLKGFNSLVRTLHVEIVTNKQLEIDTSHFFWLLTYFLKFATQIELDLEHVGSVLSYDIVSYLTAEGVNLCEQFELAIKLDGNDLKPCIRRLHLVVTAIREFVQAIEVYKKMGHMDEEDQDILTTLQIKMCETQELRSLLVLLLRHYDQEYQSKQYLQDLVVTNHILLMFLDSIMKLPEYNGTSTMHDHIKQFSSADMMYRYGLVLEDYENNGEYINDCVFTLMHHVSGEVGCILSLFQPSILRTFTSIWKSDFEICDDWSDLIEYVVKTFIKKPHTAQRGPAGAGRAGARDSYGKRKAPGGRPAPRAAAKDAWTEDEISSLTWIYMQCNTLSDEIGEVVKLLKEDGINKTRQSVIRELFKQTLIKKDDFKKFMKVEADQNPEEFQTKKEMKNDETGTLCEQLALDGKVKMLTWVQSVLLEICFVKIYLQKNSLDISTADGPNEEMEKTQSDSDEPMTRQNDLPAMSPVSYHSLLFNQSVPLIPWNCEQATVCKDLKFLQLLHKLGFHMPVDTGKVFIRIPHYWTPDVLYEVAAKVLPIDTSKLKFSLDDISESSIMSSTSQSNRNISVNLAKDANLNVSPDNVYQVHKQKYLASVVNFTPMPGSSFNSACDDSNKPNWLEMVRKSQEYKLNLDSSRSPIPEDGEIDTDMTELRSAEVINPADIAILSNPMPTTTTLTETIFSMPTIMSAKQGAASFDLHQIETEFNSVCETASVASDLTRMYVSDGDDKSELLAPGAAPPADDQLSSDSDGVAGKRPRILFTPPF